jgi:hypothetical protein
VCCQVLQSFATNRRSRCGFVRGRPVLSSQFSLGAAPQVGQRTESTCLGLSSALRVTLFVADRADRAFEEAALVRATVVIL